MSKDKEIVISARNLSKKFNVSKTINRKNNLRDFVSRNKSFEKVGTEKRIEDDFFWAVRDISFDVYKGETLGVIGPNGAGKSTLLKVLSRIYAPDEGEFTIHGRISSLLEVGTGFHPELTGRENVFFNGALLGMTRQEIEDKYDEIVEFSELGNFINSPIKYYSSGMRSRLGFSVAVSLDAEVMIVDEALAVGDASFRKKAMEKMQTTALSGKTVVFVTHSLDFIRQSCERTLYIDGGRVKKIGDTDEVLDLYMDKQDEHPGSTWKKKKSITGDSRIEMQGMKMLVNGKEGQSAFYKDTAQVELSYKVDRVSKTYSLGYGIFDIQNRRIWRSGVQPTKKGVNKITLDIPLANLKPGEYHIIADADIKNESWVVNPYKVASKVGFTLTDTNDDMWDAAREGIILTPKN